MLTVSPLLVMPDHRTGLPRDRFSLVAFIEGSQQLSALYEVRALQPAAMVTRGKEAHCQCNPEHFGEAIQREGDDGKGDVGAQDAQAGNGGQIPEKGLLTHRQPCVQDDRRQEEPASIAYLLSAVVGLYCMTRCSVHRLTVYICGRMT